MKRQRKKQNTKMSQSDIDDIKRMLDAGERYGTIASYIGCYYANVAYWAQKLGYKRMPRYTHEEKLAIINKAKGALSVISRQYGLSVANICSLVTHEKYYSDERTEA